MASTTALFACSENLNKASYKLSPYSQSSSSTNEGESSTYSNSPREENLNFSHGSPLLSLEKDGFELEDSPRFSLSASPSPVSELKDLLDAEDELSLILGSSTELNVKPRISQASQHPMCKFTNLV